MLANGKAEAMSLSFNKAKTIEQLVGDHWDKPAFDSHLVTTIHCLRQKPLEKFTVEDLRIMIGQNIGLPFLIPLALEHLEQEPIAEGDLYAGDLLQAVSRVDGVFWITYPDLFQRVRNVIGQVKDMLPALDEFDRQEVIAWLAKIPSELAG